MTFWLRSRRLQACLVTILGTSALTLVLYDTYITLPTIFSITEVQFPVVAFLPLALASLMAYSLHAGNPVLEAVASRPVNIFDSAYAVGAVGITFGLMVALRLLLSADELLMAGRNAVGYVGLCLIAFRIVGPLLAPMIPTGFVIVCTLVGVNQVGQVEWWAWPLAPYDHQQSWLTAIGLLISGSLLLSLWGGHVHR